MANKTHHVLAELLEADPTWVGVNIPPLHSLNPSESIDTKTDADTTLSRTGNNPFQTMSLNKREWILLITPISFFSMRILDIGTGTGIWAIDAAESSAYNSVKKLPIFTSYWNRSQPNSAKLIFRVPPNVSFQIDGAESDWSFARDSFDLIHIRHLNGGIKDWGKLIKQSFNKFLSNSALKPGDWLDVAEFGVRLKCDDGTLPGEGNMLRYYDLVNEAADKLGQEFKIAASLDGFILDAGFDKLSH
ncbi:hypothetical protein B9Z19DRAFT_1062329 [Tuber borchii]|uniref:S-adenosyl-L-methionine-dependent methyltransferase n=1 Tax=Tuber borchii TaxID=42251 RepID=A0A2T7A298_TUBBO|nr:hypothetical protein B9Z19DRAFT_1062329 [Tuber borchii]